MALDRQINMYSVDTGHFYSNAERALHNSICRYRKEQTGLKERLAEYEELLLAYGYRRKDLKALTAGKIDQIPVIFFGTNDLLYRYLHISQLIKHKQRKARETKCRILTLFSNKTVQNERTNGKDHIRSLREEDINDTNVISVFESALTRMLGIKQDELTESLLVVQVYYFDIFKDLSFNGFMFRGEKYRYYTSSAGQIRKKKAVFIKEALWTQYERTILCGLTIDKINAKGGNNVNKHLAYMALTSSATDPWEEFDIDKTIVVNDFETDVFGTYDYIDDQDYSVTRRSGYVPVTHTDGAGMVLPSVLKKNAMFRAPWIKGLLGVFDFIGFIRENSCSGLITDIYGKEHDVIAEDIRIIFTKSQFKMHKYYDSWEEYKTFFMQYRCTAGLCNVEEDRIKNAKINYQMLQTLTDITDQEIGLLAQKSVHKLTNLCASPKNMLEALGVTPYNTNMTPFQKALRLYPALLNDTYTKDILRCIKESLLKKYRSGKLEINGKYAFLLPDFYAACEHWFGHEKNPQGLLADREVFCRLFPDSEKLDCLRSPHLYKEHAVRYNTACKAYGERAAAIRKWFVTDALYTSSRDLVSKLLQFDVDGDKSLVVSDPVFISIAERNMNGIVPLYYNMKKADPTQLNRQTIYNGLCAAFTGGNIGIYSNDIAKIWNSDVFLTGTAQEKENAIAMIKLLCMENNFVIDYAKTLYKPERPKWVSEKLTAFTAKKLPAFFEFAKDKDKSQIEERNKSLVNRLYGIIPDKPISTRGILPEKPDYRKMMYNEKIRCAREVSDLYDYLNPRYRYKLNMKEEYADNLHYIAEALRTQFTAVGYSQETIADMLVQYVYGKNIRYKELLWFCFGNHIVRNLERNIPAGKTKYIPCTDCGEWIEIGRKDNRTCRCRTCQSLYKKAYHKEYMRQRRSC